MTRLFRTHKILNILKVPIRHKHPDHHWSVQRKKKSPTQKALDHFDDFYKKVYGESWKSIRSALLNKDHKYIAIVNNFSEIKSSCEDLEKLGAMDMKKIYAAFQKNILDQQESLKKKELLTEINLLDKSLDDVVADKLANMATYNKSSDTFEDGLGDTKKTDTSNVFQPVKLQSIESDVTKVDNNSRIIHAHAGIAASQLYEYVPATKLKGMDDFVLESEHYNYYKKDSEFFVKTIKEYTLNFPDNILAYTFEEASTMKFPKPKNRNTDVIEYFVLDGASILPVLSLDLQPGDKMLDMCAAPGGKSMIAYQTLYLQILVANDIQLSRINRINDFINDIIPDEGTNNSKLFVTQSDARHIDEKDIYNKILVDVPCTTDRHVLHEDDNNIFKGTRIKERLRMPEVQSEILANALKIVKLGGTVVYSTCSLSPIQNDGVVHMALKKAYEESNVVFVVKDQTRALKPLQYLYNFADIGLRYGHIVVPSKSRNWGPMYFCKMVRMQ